MWKKSFGACLDEVATGTYIISYNYYFSTETTDDDQFYCCKLYIRYEALKFKNDIQGK